MSGYWASVLTPVLVDAIAVLGLYVVVNSGRISAGHAIFMALGSYTAAVVTTHIGGPLWLAVLTAGATAAIFGLVFASIIEPLDHWFFAIATLAFAQVMVGIVSNIDAIGGPMGIYGIRTGVNIWIALGCLAVATIAITLFDRSPWGRETRAVRDSPQAAEMLGFNVRWIHVRAFVIGAAIAGFAGALRVGYMGVVNPTEASFERSLMLLVYLTVGGRALVVGGLIGTLVLGTLPDLLRFVGEYRLEFYGALVTLVMIVRPSGLTPRLRRLRL